MKSKSYLLFVLLLAMLTACGGGDSGADSAEEPVLYEHESGISLYMSEGFNETEVEGLFACYEGEKSNVRIDKETFETLATVGYDGSLSLEEYAELIKGAYELNGEVQSDDHGNVYIPYTVEVEGTSVSYYAFFDKGSDAFWMTTFMCATSQAAAMEENFHFWASTIEIP